jgi:hypothetical protein
MAMPPLMIGTSSAAPHTCRSVSGTFAYIAEIVANERPFATTSFGTTT